MWPQSIADHSGTVWCFDYEPWHGQWANYVADDGSGEMLSVFPFEVLVISHNRQGLSFVSECQSSQAAFSSAR